MTTTDPKTLVLGIGARALGTTQELSQLIASVFQSHHLSLADVSLLTTVDHRSGHAALTAVAAELGVPVRGFDAETLAAITVPTPSKIVLARTDASGVAEASVLATGAALLVDKQSSQSFTVAVGRSPSVDLGHHGDSEVGDGLVDFAVNVAVTAPPAWLRLELETALNEIARYPDTAPAVAALARLHRCPRSSVLVTNGAAEALTLIASARRWVKPLVVHPQFTEPELALRAHGHDVTRLILIPDNGFALDPAQVGDDVDLIVIGNPTNPTSRLHPRGTVLSLLRPGRLVVVDEAFMDVVAPDNDGSQSVVDDALRCEGLVVVRSLTKSFGLAGVRAGYLIGSSQIVAECAVSQPHWSVNSLAVAAVVACASPRGQTHAAAIRDELPQRLSYLMTQLIGLGFEVVPRPAGPFVLVRHVDAARLRDGLRRRGIAVRRGDTFPGLGPEWLRVSVRGKSATDVLVAALVAEMEDLR